MRRQSPIYKYLLSCLLIGSLLAVPVVTASQSGSQKPYRNDGKAMLPASPSAPGDLDPTFDSDGWRVDATVPGGGQDHGQVVLVQTDGRIVTIGASSPTGCSATRHLADGTLDASFGNDGKVLGLFGGASCSPEYMAAELQSDGKIVFVELGLLARVNSDGSPDTAFGTNGTVSTGGFYTSMAIQGDGKIVVAGRYFYNCDEKGCYDSGFALARYNSDGSQDNSYGNVQTPVGLYSYATALGIQSDGKIVAAGSWRDTGAESAAIIRYNIDGTLDSSFGIGGIVKPQTSFIRAVALQNDGKILAAFVGGVARYNSEGALDGSFGNAGVIRSPSGGAYAIDLQPDGRIVAMATPFIRRYNANGSPDTSFGTGGTVTVLNGVANFFALQSDGKIVAGGYYDAGTNDDFFLVRYNPNGSADVAGFKGGIVTTDIGSRSLSGNAVAIQPDGKIVVAGIAFNPHPKPTDYPGSPTDFRQFAVVRYNPDGSLDNTFHGDGKVTTAFALKAEAQDIGVQPDGKIVVTGFAYSQQPGTFDWAIARYNRDGSLDSTFSEDGKLTLNPNTYSGSVTSLVISADGKLIIGGYSTSGSNSGGFTLLRLNADGSLDGSFGNGGIVTTVIGPGSEIWAMSIDAADRIVAAGNSGGGANFALARYNSNGSLDTSFDGDGIVTTSFGAQLQFATAVAIQWDGKIIAAGWVRDEFNAGYDNFAVARYNPDGSLDTSFDGDGRVVTDSGSIYDEAAAVSVQRDGTIIVAGHPGLMVRYNSNGSPDASFGNGGIQHLGGNYLSGMVIDSSNRAVLVGTGLYIARVLLGGSGPTPTPTPTPTPAPPATITVTNTNDSGAGSLRQAIADVTPGGTINFDASVFATPQTITLTSGQLVIDKNLTIQGPGASLLSISGNHASRVFSINSGVTAFLGGMTIKDGIANYCGGIESGGTLTIINSTISGNRGAFYGGGICNGFGILTVVNSIIFGNRAGSAGGGIFNEGSLTVISSVIHDNTAEPFNADLIALGGGGIADRLSSTQTYIINSTVSGNHAYAFQDDDGNSYGGFGGGIVNFGGLNITNSTISGNSGDINNTSGGIPGGGIQSGGTETLRNTIVAGNTGPVGDISGIIETASHNLIGDAASSGGIANGVNGNIVGVNPRLGPLQNNGGPTMTHALLPGSPAINAGNNCVLTANGCGNGSPALPTDQRGMPRNGDVDIGAFERQTNDPDGFARADFDGDGTTDLSVFRPSDGNWYALKSGGGVLVTSWGAATDTTVPGDYDHDGKADMAVYRPSSGQWFILRSSDFTVNVVGWGAGGDVPTAGDFDGDGKADEAVYRPSAGQWFVFRSSDNGASIINWGNATDVPVQSDYDGDGKTDVAVFRPSTGQWFLFRSTDGPLVAGWGIAGDKPIEADYDGDNKDDIAVYRPSDGNWYIFRSSDSSASIINWGNATDVPVPGDYDGDGKDDEAIYRDGTWFVLQSTAGVLVANWGVAGDIPIPAKYIP